MQSRIATINIGLASLSYLKFDILFIYNTTMVEIHPYLILSVSDRNKGDDY